MILAAALLVLAGLGLFVGGLVTGVTAFYWGCVAACLVAAGLLVVARRQAAPAAASAPPADGPGAAAVAGTEAPAETSSDVAVPPAEAEQEDADPPVEDVEVTDLLLVVDLKDEVLVVDEHPRYHVADCPWVGSRTTVPLPLDEARTDGFTPCGVCRPDATLADRVREKRHSADT